MVIWCQTLSPLCVLTFALYFTHRCQRMTIWWGLPSNMASLFPTSRRQTGCCRTTECLRRTRCWYLWIRGGQGTRWFQPVRKESAEENLPDRKNFWNCIEHIRDPWFRDRCLRLSTSNRGAGRLEACDAREDQLCGSRQPFKTVGPQLGAGIVLHNSTLRATNAMYIRKKTEDIRCLDGCGINLRLTLSQG